METFVVNLARRPDRRASMERKLPPAWKAEYTTRWTGPLDGASIAPGDLDGFGLFPWQMDCENEWWNRPLKLGEIGCAVSHWLCWRRAVQLGAETALILEDDVELAAGIEHELPERLAALEAHDPAWDVVYLGRWALEPDGETVVADGLVRPGYSFCTFGYMLSAAGLSKVLGVGFEQDLIPVDELLPALYLDHPRPDVRRRYPARLSAYAFEPPLVVQLPKDVAGSDTEATPFVQTP